MATLKKGTIAFTSQDKIDVAGTLGVPASGTALLVATSGIISSVSGATYNKIGRAHV